MTSPTLLGGALRLAGGWLNSIAGRANRQGAEIVSAAVADAGAVEARLAKYTELLPHRITAYKEVTVALDAVARAAQSWSGAYGMDDAARNQLTDDLADALVNLGIVASEAVYEAAKAAAAAARESLEASNNAGVPLDLIDPEALQHWELLAAKKWDSFQALKNRYGRAVREEIAGESL